MKVFVTEEIASIRVESETWRRLKVTFPDNVKSHTREQISCFGPDGLLRRHDYTVDILGGATGLNYASAYRNVDGIVVPTKTSGVCVRRRLPACEGTFAGRNRQGRDHPSLAIWSRRSFHNGGTRILPRLMFAKIGKAG